MDSNIRDKKLKSLRISQRWLWLGPAAGILCMVVLFVAGLATETAPWVVISASLVPLLGAIWVSSHVGVRTKIAEVEKA